MELQTEIEKDISLLLEIIQAYYPIGSITFSIENKFVACPPCFLNYIDNTWTMSINHSYVKDSYEIEDCVSLMNDFISNDLVVEVVPGAFLIAKDLESEKESCKFDIISAYDVWEYCERYNVSEEFAVIALTARLMEKELKGEMH